MADIALGSRTFRRPLILAPMEDVSTAPFRELCIRHGADLVFTEFIHAGTLLQRTPVSLRKLAISPGERPCGVQLFGEDVRTLADAARVAVDAGADVVDLNIGCPVKKIVCKGAGAALLRDLDLTRRILSAIRAIVPAEIPVTAKARIGWDDQSINILELARLAEGEGCAMLSIHARTRVQQYTGDADWAWIARAKESVSMPIVGNGDVETVDDVQAMFDRTGCDGVMIGRAAIGRPWFFDHAKRFLATGERSAEPGRAERMELLLAHIEAEVARVGERTAVFSMRKQVTPYLRGVADLRELRARLMGAESLDAVREVLEPGARLATAGTSPGRSAFEAGTRR